MSKYVISYSVEGFGQTEIEASSLEEAKDIFNKLNYGLATNDEGGVFLGSIKVDHVLLNQPTSRHSSLA
jgi:hypothetical protein